jgi:8-oxo-dGTP pyrophosphatase MutT (NUDIX family)
VTATANPERNPWTVLHTSVVYANRWIRIEHCDVLDPSGRDGVYGIVRYLHSTVATLAVDSLGRVCLVGQYRLPHRAYAWEIPGGGAPPNEDVLVAAQRELREETGCEAADWLPLPSLCPSNGTTDEVAFPFVAWTLVKTAARPEPTELIRVEWVPFWEAVARVEAGGIRDATTVAAILRVALMAMKMDLPDTLARALSVRPEMAGDCPTDM